MWERYRLSAEQLEETAGRLAARVREGLARDGEEIRCLPAWLARPPADLAGEALALDAGGTNQRAARVRIGPDGPVFLGGPAGGALPTGREGAIPAEAFFAPQAVLLRTLGGQGDLPLGYCFSYPAEVRPDGDAVLLRWTKEVRVEGVVGRPVGALLAAALEAAGGTRPRVTVLNDTVACLMAGAAAEADAWIGLIVGTGTNMAAFVPCDGIPKLAGAPGLPAAMAVNLESGNFHPGCLTEADDRLDLASENPGAQRFEKAVSGVYLGRLLAAEIPGLEGAAVRGAAALTALRYHPDAPPGARDLAAALLDRSADLVAAGLAGLAGLLLPRGGRLRVQAEGGLFRGAEGYAGRVGGTLRQLLGPGTAVTLASVENANLVGAAAAALR
ncbi:MAG: hypothetical protein FJ098_00075 [Deltaproteobacteria bacterium]|nr:hypothetical protein [Deltaproteobacteria bacterium]